MRALQAENATLQTSNVPAKLPDVVTLEKLLEEGSFPLAMVVFIFRWTEDILGG